MSYRYTIVQELQSSVYHTLLDFLLANSNRITFAIRPTMRISESCDHFLKTIEPDLLHANDSSSWPGTTLIDAVARVYCYRSSVRLGQAMKAAAASLYDWRLPHLPEDPVFYRADGSVLFTTIAHEGDAYLTVDIQELERIREILPTLALEPF